MSALKRHDDGTGRIGVGSSRITEAFRLDRAARAKLLAIVLAVLTGHIVDRTTGQPLTGVEIRATGTNAAPADGNVVPAHGNVSPAHGNVAPAHSNDSGSYTLKGLAPGHYTLTVSSDDVPPQTFEVTIGAAKMQHFDITACSTTLDYSCAAAP